jgi:hypothetical protein
MSVSRLTTESTKMVLVIIFIADAIMVQLISNIISDSELGNLVKAYTYHLAGLQEKVSYIFAIHLIKIFFQPKLNNYGL